MITVWKYAQAPQNLRDLKPLCDAETWVLTAPASLCTEVAALVKSNCARFHQCEVPDGTVVFFCQALNEPRAIRPTGEFSLSINSLAGESLNRTKIPSL